MIRQLRLGVAIVAMFSITSTVFGASVVRKSVMDGGMYALAANGDSNRGDDGRMDFNTAGDGIFVQFDLSDVLGPGESIVGASLELFSARSSNQYDAQLVGYPLMDAWQEGVGNSGVSGGSGFPWGPASVGDAVYNYKQAMTVGAGDAPFDGTDVATSGEAWITAGGRGIGSDVVDRILFDMAIAADEGAEDEGDAYPPIAFNDSGISVLNDMASGALANYGFNVFTTGGEVLPNNGWRIATRELAARRGDDGIAPTLVLSVVPEPNSLVLMVMGFLGLIGRARRNR